MAAYGEFIYWTHRKLGKGIRKVIPSCIVAIRHEFPEANNIIYTLDLKFIVNCELTEICIN